MLPLLTSRIGSAGNLHLPNRLQAVAAVAGMGLTMVLAAAANAAPITAPTRTAPSIPSPATAPTAPVAPTVAPKPSAPVAGSGAGWLTRQTTRSSGGYSRLGQGLANKPAAAATIPAPALSGTTTTISGQAVQPALQAETGNAKEN